MCEAAVRVWKWLLGPWAAAARWLDRLDERRARHRRATLGLKRWLLSWHRRADGRWVARLSGPATVRTIERAARTRAAAIARSERALTRLEAWRTRRTADRGRGTTP